LTTAARTIAEAAASLRSGARRATDLVAESLTAVDRHNPTLNAFIRVDADAARAAAEIADAERARGIDRGPLHGIPISIKDLIDVIGQPTTAASKVLRDHVATSNAPIVTRLHEAGAVIIGKTNLHEFALGTTGEESAFGPVRHPADHDRVTGGSSSGSAAAVSTGMGLGSIGTDTGGSIRIPAAACGLVGLKPSIGEVPTSGVIPLSWTLDHVGPLARTVEDAAWIWEALTGASPRPLAPFDLATLTLGSLNGYFTLVEPGVRVACDSALADLRSHGVLIREETLPETAIIATTYVSVVLAEAARWHTRYLDTRAADYTPAVRQRIDSGRSITAVAYLNARDVQASFARAVDAMLDRADALVLPALAILAPPLGTSDVSLGASSPERLPIRTAMLRQTQLFNLTGHPAISVPVRAAGLPVGLQLVGPLGRTRHLLEIAAAVAAVVSPPIA
jgi:aspartyl-tRNA(Asn)/glutamyl-tRNA(Gln) amidotransferase subunit A